MHSARKETAGDGGGGVSHGDEGCWGGLDMRMAKELLVELGMQMGGVLLAGVGKELVESTAGGDVNTGGVVGADAWAETHIMPSVGIIRWITLMQN